jgi:CTP:molybdopterin cytidylyltransferase MocA
LIAAVVLAAGAATRYGSPKQLVFLPGVLERLAQTSVEEIVVVEGAYPLDALQLPARIVRCRDWERGPGRSLRCGLAELGSKVRAAVVVLADGPDLDPRAVERLIAHRTDASVVAASYDGTRGHPTVLSRETWARVPDEGGRVLDAKLVDCSDLRPPGDFDYPP